MEERKNNDEEMTNNGDYLRKENKIGKKSELSNKKKVKKKEYQ